MHFVAVYEPVGLPLPVARCPCAYTAHRTDDIRPQGDYMYNALRTSLLFTSPLACRCPLPVACVRIPRTAQMTSARRGRRFSLFPFRMLPLPRRSSLVAPRVYLGPRLGLPEPRPQAPGARPAGCVLYASAGKGHFHCPCPAPRAAAH
jgi:hypothetical protein